jgi:hypothetical protein
MEEGYLLDINNLRDLEKQFRAGHGKLHMRYEDWHDKLKILWPDIHFGKHNRSNIRDGENKRVNSIFIPSKYLEDTKDE